MASFSRDVHTTSSFSNPYDPHSIKEGESLIGCEVEIVSQDLDGHVPVQDWIMRQVHPSHGPLTQQSHDLIAANLGNEGTL